MRALAFFCLHACILWILSVNVIEHEAVCLSNSNFRNNMIQPGDSIFNFTADATVEDWVEQSDNKTQVFRRAVFFSLLNPQPNGAGFAGMRILTDLNLSCGNRILLKARGQGNTHYKIILRHKGENDEPYPTYENFFEIPMEFSIVPLYLEEFKPYYRGRPLNSTEAKPLDTSAITSFGIQIYGGVYSQFKQHGPSSLEIDWISLG
ncbi:uncharacterized protein [Hetaerina americana]|uniref:uncharacterized protein isoform X2 n=1 Tax=Hetaerina americana TaxID=62018 RepID=UPI003A7F100A